LSELQPKAHTLANIYKLHGEINVPPLIFFF